MAPFQNVDEERHQLGFNLPTLASRNLSQILFEVGEIEFVSRSAPKESRHGVQPRDLVAIK